MSLPNVQTGIPPGGASLTRKSNIGDRFMISHFIINTDEY